MGCSSTVGRSSKATKLLLSGRRGKELETFCRDSILSYNLPIRLRTLGVKPITDLLEQGDRVHTRAAVRGEMRKQKRRRTTIAVVVVCALAVGITGGLIFALSRGGGEPKVPGVVGMSYQEAERELENTGLDIDIDPDQDIRDMAAEEVGKATIDDQNPKEGSTAGEGTMVTVHLKGIEDYPEEQPEEQPEEAQPAEPETQEATAPALIPPLEGRPLYPFTKDASITCGHWPSGSQDYPNFEAARDNNSRRHAGIDVYPPAGEGATTKAMKDGTILRVATFYTRYTGEVTYAVLVDHGDFVANYAELQPPTLKAGDKVKQGDLLGYISGTEQLHFEMYTPGTTDWISGWYGAKPANLLDATEMMLQVYGIGPAE